MRAILLVLGLLIAAFAAFAAFAACGRSDDAPVRGAPTAPAATAPPVPDAGDGVRVLSTGSEPRARAAFAFVAGRTEKATLELTSQWARAGAPLGEERLRLRLGVRYTAEDTVELTVLAVETTSATMPRVGSAVGARFVQKVARSGHADLPELTLPPGCDPRAADYVKGAVIQVASNLLPVVPAEPIGEGARWAVEDLRYTLLAPPGKTIEVERRSGRDGPQRLKTGETVVVREEQTYRIDAPLDGIARHVEALLVADHSPSNAEAPTKLTTRLRFDVEADR